MWPGPGGESFVVLVWRFAQRGTPHLFYCGHAAPVAGGRVRGAGISVSLLGFLLTAESGSRTRPIMRLYTKNANNVFKGRLDNTAVLCITPVVGKIEASRGQDGADEALGMGNPGGQKRCCRGAVVCGWTRLCTMPLSFTQGSSTALLASSPRGSSRVSVTADPL